MANSTQHTPAYGFTNLLIASCIFLAPLLARGEDSPSEYWIGSGKMRHMTQELRERILKAVCTVYREGNCKGLKRYPSECNSGVELEEWISGTFGKEGEQFLLVRYKAACEARSSNYGGTVVLKSRAFGFDLARWLQGTVPANCRVLAEGLNEVAVCASFSTSMEGDVGMLWAFSQRWNEPVADLVALKDDRGGRDCHSWNGDEYKVVFLDDWKQPDPNSIYLKFEIGRLQKGQTCKGKELETLPMNAELYLENDKVMSRTIGENDYKLAVEFGERKRANGRVK